MSAASSHIRPTSLSRSGTAGTVGLAAGYPSRRSPNAVTCARQRPIIQREACEASGRHIPLIVENVRGAQPWVGRARWNFGSFYLWGDVPALMPVTFKAPKVPGFRFDGSGKSFQTASVDGLKSAQDGLGGYGGNFGWNNTPMRRGNSKSLGRKMASAMIAKIPLPLSQYIAATFRPQIAQAAE